MSQPPRLARGRYEEYKTRTATFVRWLTETARKCCQLSDVVVGVRGSKGAKRAQKTREEVPLTTNEIILLAEKIASKEKISIPAWVLSLLASIIKRRAEASVAYQARSAAGDSGLEHSNRGHAYFVDVLQRAHQILSSVKVSRIERPSAASKAPAPAQDQSVRNLFETLDLEEPSDTPWEQIAGSAYDDETELPRFNFRVDTKREEDISIELWCLLEDLNELRQFVETTWKEHARGEVTVMVAGKTTNVAFGMMRRAAEAFVAKYPKFEDYFSVLEFFKLRMVSEKRHVIVCRDTCRIEGAGGEATSGLQPEALDPHTASLLCLSGATIVRDLMRKVRDPSYEPQANGHGFAELLYEGSPEIRRFCKDPRFLEQQAGSMAGDTFLHGILSVASNDDNASTPLWLAVAAQCYKSVYDALDGNMNAGARQYVAVLKDSVDTPLLP